MTRLRRALAVITAASGILLTIGLPLPWRGTPPPTFDDFQGTYIALAPTITPAVPALITLMVSAATVLTVTGIRARSWDAMSLLGASVVTGAIVSLGSYIALSRIALPDNHSVEQVLSYLDWRAFFESVMVLPPAVFPFVLAGGAGVYFLLRLLPQQEEGREGRALSRY